MGAAGHIAGRLRRSERGFTLIELLVASTIAMVVLGGAATVFVGAIRSEPRASSKVSAIERGRVAVERMTRELRQGSGVAGTPSASELALITYLPNGTCGASSEEGAEACRVTYACAAGECTRTVSQPDGSEAGAAAQAVSGLTSSEVFSYSPPVEPESESEPEYVSVELSFETREGGPVVVADGAALRNAGS
jgi:prepilin-type N-terminal cleavage/methylation domain-containing protein